MSKIPLGINRFSLLTPSYAHRRRQFTDSDDRELVGFLAIHHPSKEGRMGNAVYKLLTEQARIFLHVLPQSGTNLTRNLSLTGGLGEHDTPGCRGGNDTRITRAASITTSRCSNRRTDCLEGPFPSGSKQCSRMVWMIWMTLGRMKRKKDDHLRGSRLLALTQTERARVPRGFNLDPSASPRQPQNSRPLSGKGQAMPTIGHQNVLESLRKGVGEKTRP